MLPQTVMALVIAGQAVLSGATSFSPGGAGGSAGNEAPAADARYEAASREVTNWRSQASGALDPKPIILLAALFGVERPVVTRCVKLNNYWCIKSARWNGEIGRDGEGHVGFASAEQGADAAALLLRRYYLDFNRKSALDIVRRWAPAECNLFDGFGALGGFALAVKGIGGTVRAKYLAAHRIRLTAEPAKGAKKGAPSGRVSLVIPMGPSKTPAYRVPDIAAGMGESAKPQPSRTIAAAGRPASVSEATFPSKRAPKPARPAGTAAAAESACAPDEARLRNYAARIVAPLGIGPDDDLKIFDQQGRPSPRLATVMLAMAGFELGLLQPASNFVEGALARMRERILQDEQAQAKAPTP